MRYVNHMAKLVRWSSYDLCKRKKSWIIERCELDDIAETMVRGIVDLGQVVQKPVSLTLGKRKFKGNLATACL